MGWVAGRRSRGPVSRGSVEWLGTAPVKATVELMLDAWKTGGTIVTALNSARIMAPLDPSTEPPVVYVYGVVGIPSTLPFVVQSLDLSDWQLRKDGQPARATATFSCSSIGWGTSSRGRAGEAVVVAEREAVGEAPDVHGA
jgi:hypothetical protein